MLAIFLSLLARLFSFALGVLTGCATGGGRGRCRVAAAYVSAGSMLAVFFITISPVIFVRTRSGFCGVLPAVVEGRCRVVAAYVSAGSILAKFFITISHCAWRHFLSWSFGDKETKQRKRLSTICIKCPQLADHCFWFPRRTVLAKPRTLETLLLANSYSPTLRHQCSRARSMAHRPSRPHPAV
jgi:hypothetical protein